MPPRLVGDGPPTFSTCTELVRQPAIVWDTNRYYRDLGVPTNASRQDIKRAYLERGTNSVRLTYVAKQLLNPQVRRAYDLTPLGSVFVDRYVVAQVRRTMARQQQRAGVAVHLAPSRPDSAEVLDTDSTDRESPPRTTGTTGTTRWPWGYYLWDTDTHDTGRLALLQERLASILGKQSKALHLAVGLRGGMVPPVEVTVVGRRTVVFLRDGEDPTDAVAHQAAASIHPTPATPTTEMRPAMGFRKGADEAANASKGGAQFAKTHYLQIEDGKSEIIRLLTDKDDWVVVDQHNNVPTKGKPEGHEGNWPEKMGAVCRKDVAFTGMYADCFICDHIVGTNGVKRPSGRTWALACLREQVIENGQVVGIRDKTREVAVVGEDGKPTGETTTERAVVVVNMGYKNFFGALNGFAGYYGTVLDRDYLVKRSGSGTDTVYNIIPLDPITMPDGSKFDCRNPEHAAKYGVTEGMLEEIVTERSSDDFYARFFDTRVAIPTRKGEGGSGSAPAQAQAPAKADNDTDPGRLAALADRVKGYGPAAGEAVATPSSAPAGGSPSPAGSAPAGGMRAFD